MNSAMNSATSSTPPHNGQRLSNDFRLSTQNGCQNSNQTVMSSLSSAHRLVHDLSSTTASTLTPLSATAGERTRIVAPPVEIKLFVGRVPRNNDEVQLRGIFAEFGVVRDVIIIRDRDTAGHKGCAFVRMASITKADAAIRALNNIKVLDPSLGPLQVKYAFGEPERLGLLIENAQPGVDQAKLFVGSLPKGATEEDIHSVFARFGDVDEVFVMKDEQKVSKGCAFVRLAFKEEALNAIANLNGKFTMPGGTRAMEVRFAENKKVQQQPIAYAAITGVLPSALRSSGASSWLEYVSPEGRPYYYSIQTGHTQWERPIELDAAITHPVQHPVQHQVQHPNVIPGGVGAQTHGPPGANVFIFHIPNDWSEHDLVSNFSAFGQIVSARIATDKGSGRRLGFGFVSFRTIEASVQAVMTLNGYSVSGKRLKVTIKRGEEQYAAPFLPPGFNGAMSVSQASVQMSLQNNSRISTQTPSLGGPILGHGSTRNPMILNSQSASSNTSTSPDFQAARSNPLRRGFNHGGLNSSQTIGLLGSGGHLSMHSQGGSAPNVPNYPTHQFSGFPNAAHYSQASMTAAPTATTAH